MTMQGVAANGMAMPHNMPPQSQQHQQNNINAMAAAVGNSSNRMGGTSSQYQAHAVPRPTHIPGQVNNNSSSSTPNQHARQSSVQAA
jgi:hypothetical protein